MRVVLLRTNACNPDPRVEKELNSLLKLSEVQVKCVCWDRDSKYSYRDSLLSLPGGEVPITRFGIPASWGGGMRANLLPMIKFEWKLLWWLIKHQQEYDCIHACDLPTGLPARLVCRMFNKKMVYDIFDYYSDTQHGSKKILKALSKLENRIINSSDATIICSEKREEQIASTHPKELLIIHNSPSEDQIKLGLDTDFSLKKETTQVRVVYVGNLVEDRLIMNALSCAKYMPHIEFHIGGFGVLEEKIRELALQFDNILFYGKLNYKEVLSLEKSCDIMLALYDPSIPNHKYAAPNKFYEALALGKPLVMIRNTGMDDIIDKHGIGIVCEHTEESICEAITALSNRRDEWINMGKEMKKIFSRDYSWDIMEQRLLKMYREMSKEFL